jgi:hypothetical protein
LRGNPTVGEDTIASFISAATLLEHRAFSEEREVRIVGIPHSADAMAAHGARDHLVGWPPTKKVLQSAHSKKYLALFDGLGESLPIKRIIVGPSANQSDDLEFARLLTMGKVDVVLSRTPYIG